MAFGDKTKLYIVTWTSSRGRTSEYRVYLTETQQIALEARMDALEDAEMLDDYSFVPHTTDIQTSYKIMSAMIADLEGEIS